MQSNQRFQFVFGQGEISCQFDGGNLIALTFNNIDRDVYVFFVRRNGNLRRLDIEFQKTLVHVERLQFFQIGSQLLA